MTTNPIGDAFSKTTTGTTPQTIVEITPAADKTFLYNFSIIAKDSDSLRRLFATFCIYGVTEGASIQRCKSTTPVPVSPDYEANDLELDLDNCVQVGWEDIITIEVQGKENKTIDWVLVPNQILEV